MFTLVPRMKTTDSLSPCLIPPMKRSRSAAPEMGWLFNWMMTSPTASPALSAIEPFLIRPYIRAKDDGNSFPACFAHIGHCRPELGRRGSLRLSDKLFKSRLVKTHDCLPVNHGYRHPVLPGKPYGLLSSSRVRTDIMVLVGYTFA